MVDLCEAVKTCCGARHGAKPKRCTETATHERDGRRVCWSHKNSLSVRFYIDAAVPLETLLKVQQTLATVRSRQKIRTLQQALGKQQRKLKKKVCLVCANLGWHRPKPVCPGCGLPHFEEDESAYRPQLT